VSRLPAVPRMLARAPGNARACTARDVRQPRRCVLTEHPAPANLLPQAIPVGSQGGLDFLPVNPTASQLQPPPPQTKRETLVARPHVLGLVKDLPGHGLGIQGIPLGQAIQKRVSQLPHERGRQGIGDIRRYTVDAGQLQVDPAPHGGTGHHDHLRREGRGKGLRAEAPREVNKEGLDRIRADDTEHGFCCPSAKLRR